MYKKYYNGKKVDFDFYAAIGHAGNGSIYVCSAKLGRCAICPHSVDLESSVVTDGDLGFVGLCDCLGFRRMAGAFYDGQP